MTPSRRIAFSLGRSDSRVPLRSTIIGAPRKEKTANEFDEPGDIVGEDAISLLRGGK